MSKPRILVIEDNPMHMELATDLLEAAGYAVTQSRNAEEGIQLARTQVPDLILMDIRLPGMDGHSAVQLLKADARTRGIPVIALTAQAMHGDEGRAREAGFDGYVTKPIDTRSFAQGIALLLRPKERDT